MRTIYLDHLSGRKWVSRLIKHATSEPVGSRLENKLGSTSTMLVAASDPILLVLNVPIGVPASLLVADAGFGHGYAITIRESADLVGTDQGAQLRVVAFAPATQSDLPVTLYFTSLDTDGSLTRKEITGLANAWITLQGH